MTQATDINPEKSDITQAENSALGTETQSMRLSHRDNAAHSPNRYASELDLHNDAEALIWERAKHSKLEISAEVSLAYLVLENPLSSQAIVLSNGRVESYLKYRELICDCYRQGFSVYAVDHRGQGLSSRLSANPHIGHVNRFDDYIDDFSVFIDKVVSPASHSKRFLVAHSMGGAIATLFMAKHPDYFDAAVLSAPMYGIKLPLKKSFIYWLANKLDSCNRHAAPNYVLGGKGYLPEPFVNNVLTHSEPRYVDYRALYLTTPQLQLGSPSNRWLTESITAGDRCVQAASKIATPILILQASADTVVDNLAQNLSVGGHCQLEIIHGAKHEIFMEIDAIRNQALDSLFNFLTQQAV